MCVCFYVQPLSKTKAVLISADTVRFYASFIHSIATITDKTIQFGAGYSNAELLRVPLAAPGELTPDAIIQITVGINPPNADNDPIVGITDGVNRNQFQLVEHGRPSTTGHQNPCEIYGGSHNGRSAPRGNPVAGQYVLLFDPLHRFGSCSTNNGFATDGKFNSQVDASKGLSMVLHKSSSNEQYTFHYFLVEYL